MSERLIECVPNFSEGRNPAIIEAIAEAIRSCPDVHLLSIDPGAATNRTVYTFVGPPEAVVEAAFAAARTGISLIDMSRHSGEHPRFGALDVCPLVPVRGVSMEECAELARVLGRRLGELGLTIYLYEKAATRESRRNLADVRAGEYEGLRAKLADPEWAPDFGPSEFNPTTGATAVGARDFLIAYNVNLNTTSTRRANAVAFDVREKGRPVTKNGEPVLGDDGAPQWKPGKLKAVKAIGWFIEEYGLAQVSMNLTDIGVTPLHVAFDAVCESAQSRGMRVTGSELVGLVPLRAMLDAGRYFLCKQKRSTGVSDAELVKIAVKTLGLDELAPFDPQARIIEYAIEDRARKRLVDLSVRRFIEETASESPAPGGGSVAAAMGALGAALATMVANLSSHKRGWDDRWEEFSDWAERGKALHEELTRLIDEDTDAFNAIMAAYALPKGSDEEKRARSAAIQVATRGAIEIPLRVMRAAHATFEVAAAMAEQGNPNSVSDAGVGALAALAAVRGAHLNVRINAAGIKDRAWLEATLTEAARIEAASAEAEAAILSKVDAAMAAS